MSTLTLLKKITKKSSDKSFCHLIELPTMKLQKKNPLNYAASILFLNVRNINSVETTMLNSMQQKIQTST